MCSLEPVRVSCSFDPERLHEGPRCGAASADADALGGALGGGVGGRCCARGRGEVRRGGGRRGSDGGRAAGVGGRHEGLRGREGVRVVCGERHAAAAAAVVGVVRGLRVRGGVCVSASASE